MNEDFSRFTLLKTHQWPIMVLDDEIEITKAIARDLRRHATVETFSSAHEALKNFKKQEYSVVISDLKMPEMNGLDFLSQCAKIKPNTQRILLTAFVDLASLEDSINSARLNKLMTKPWEPLDLQNAVEQAQRSYELLAENFELRKMALTDGLTGLTNHRYFWERLEAEFSRAQRYGRPLSLIMCDVDDFKKYNDKYGHQKGDEVLKHIANSLEQSKRTMDTVARYGGEEFSIILPEVSRPQASEIAKRYLENMKSQDNVTASFGIASYPDDAKSSTELVYVADQALLRAKAQGKACVVTAIHNK